MSNDLPPIFISYKSDDFPIAEELYRRLVKAGFSVWFDRFRLDPGCDWHREIEAGCEAARVVLPVLTPRWRESIWTRYETYGAEQIIPLLFEGEFDKASPPPLRGKQTIDLRQPAEEKWQPLFDKIREYLARPAPEKLPRTAHLPLGHNEHFVGREALLDEIHEKLHQAPAATLTQSPAHAVAGMGGVGKTTVAREYAEKFWRAYQDILWVNAPVASALPGEFAGLALRLGLIPKLSDDTNADARLALDKLCEQTTRLLILDNALDEESVQPWIPKAGKCRTIITSRFTAWSAVKTIHIYILEPGPARELLLSRSGLADTPENRVGTDALAKELGYLPLALEQAAAYIKNKGTSFAGYLALYRENHAALLAKNELPEGQYPASVAVTWLTSIAQIGPLGKLILTLCSFLAPDAIPRPLIEAAIPIFQEAGGDLPPITSLALTDALGELFRYSLIRLAPNDGPITIHRLVQTVQRDSLPSEESRRQWAERAIHLLATEFPFDDYSRWDYCASLLLHVQSAFEWAREYGIETTDAANLLDTCGVYLVRRGQYLQAELIYRRAVEIWEKCLGQEHPGTASSLNNLAYLYVNQGKYEQAEPLCKRALEIKENALGREHPSTASSLNNLASLYRNQGKYEQAEPLYKRALEIHEKALGPEHPDTAICLDGLAIIFTAQGRYTEAEPFFKRALEIREKAQGPEHPDTSSALNNLANLYRDQGKYDQAEPLHQRALATSEKTLGSDHPWTHAARENYEKLLSLMGRKQ